MGTQDGNSEELSDDMSFVCPKCGVSGLKPMIRTSGGSYCHCRECGHVWYDERHPAQPSSLLRRRKTD